MTASLRFAGTGVDQPVAALGSVGIYTLVQVRTKHHVFAPITSIRVGFPNYYFPSNSFTETAIGGTSRTFSAGLEIPGISTQHLKFSTADTVSVDPTVPSIVWSDDLLASAFSLTDFSGQSVWVRQNWVILATESLPQSATTGSGISGEAVLYGGTSQVYGSGVLTVGTGAFGSNQLRPIAILGTHNNIALAILGDSITWGGSGNPDYGNGNPGGGWAARAAYAAGCSYFKATVPGILESDLTLANAPLNIGLLQYATHMIDQAGFNDLAASGADASAALLTSSRALRTLAKAQNSSMYIMKGLVTTKTTSSDSWATTVNQTLATGFANADAELPAANAAITADVGSNNLNASYSLRTTWNDGASTDKWGVSGAANYLTADGFHPSIQASYLASVAMTPTLASLAALTDVPAPVAFHASPYMLRGSGLSFAVDGALGTVVIWFRISGSTNSDLRMLSGVAGFSFYRGTDNKLQCYVDNGGASSLLTKSATTYTTSTTWHCLMYSWDTNHAAAGKVKYLYVDDASDLGTVTDANNAFNVDYTQTNVSIGAYTDGSLKFNGDIGYIWFDSTAAMDFSNSANRRKFINADGTWVSPGTTGQLPTGYPPILYVKGQAAVFNVNLGYGGDFAVTNGPLATANDAPAISSNGGGATASISVAENTTAVTTVTTTDSFPGSPITYSLSGTDAAKFTIGASSGVLTFTSAPDYEVPTDANSDNAYLVTVTASDGELTDTQALTVTVTNVVEARGFSMHDLADTFSSTSLSIPL